MENGKKKYKRNRIRAIAARLNLEEYNNLMSVPCEHITDKIVFLINYYFNIVSNISNGDDDTSDYD